MATKRKSKKRKVKKLQPPKTGWLLKLKAAIYRYTGIYLADKEKNEYLKFAYAENGLSQSRAGLVAGLWDVTHNFVRPSWSVYAYSDSWYFPLIRSRFVRRFIRRLVVSFLAIKCDIKELFQ